MKYGCCVQLSALPECVSALVQSFRIHMWPDWFLSSWLDPVQPWSSNRSSEICVHRGSEAAGVSPAHSYVSYSWERLEVWDGWSAEPVPTSGGEMFLQPVLVYLEAPWTPAGTCRQCSCLLYSPDGHQLTWVQCASAGLSVVRTCCRTTAVLCGSLIPVDEPRFDCVCVMILFDRYGDDVMQVDVLTCWRRTKTKVDASQVLSPTSWLLPPSFSPWMCAGFFFLKWFVEPQIVTVRWFICHLKAEVFIFFLFPTLGCSANLTVLCNDFYCKSERKTSALLTQL